MTEFCNPNLKPKMTKELDVTESEKREAEAAKIAPMLIDMLDRVKTPISTVIRGTRMIQVNR